MRFVVSVVNAARRGRPVDGWGTQGDPVAPTLLQRALAGVRDQPRRSDRTSHAPRKIRAFALAWPLVALALLAPGTARAGSFEVLACGSAPGGTQNAWFGAQTGDLTSYANNCPPSSGTPALNLEGGMAFSTRSPSGTFSASASSVASSATWTLRAPQGATVGSISGTVACLKQAGSAWLMGVRTSSGQSETPTCASTSSTRTFSLTSLAAGSVETYLSCAKPTSCDQGLSRFALLAATVRIDDTTAPVVSITGGALASGSTVSGTAGILFSASDNVGLRHARLLVDGTVEAAQDYLCDSTKVVPCPSLTNASLSVDTARFADGPHTAAVEVQDAAGNWATSAIKSFQTTNPQPAVEPDYPHSDPYDDETNLPESSEPDPIGGDKCIPDAELGADDYCETSQSQITALAVGPNSALVPGGPGWAIADQSPFLFKDSRFRELSTEKVRYLAAWDQVTRGLTAARINPASRSPDEQGDYERKVEFDRFVNEANANSQELLVGFGRSRQRVGSNDEFSDLPTLTQYKNAINATLARYRTVRQFVAWNEVNNRDQPTSFYRAGTLGPKRAAQYWKLVNSTCVSRGRTCVVLAGSFTDTDALNNANAAGAAGRSYWGRYIDALGNSKPGYWAIHPYTGGRSGSRSQGGLYSDYFRLFLRRSNAYRANSRIWITEYGHQINASFFRDDTVGGHRNIRNAMELVKFSDRIERFYYYRMFNDSFGSGLIDLTTESPRCIFFAYRYNSNPASTNPPVPSGCPSGPSTTAGYVP